MPPKRISSKLPSAPPQRRTTAAGQRTSTSTSASSNTGSAKRRKHVHKPTHSPHCNSQDDEAAPSPSATAEPNATPSEANQTATSATDTRVPSPTSTEDSPLVSVDASRLPVDFDSTLDARAPLPPAPLPPGAQLRRHDAMGPRQRTKTMSPEDFQLALSCAPSQTQPDMASVLQLPSSGNPRLSSAVQASPPFGSSAALPWPAGGSLLGIDLGEPMGEVTFHGAAGLPTTSTLDQLSNSTREAMRSAATRYGSDITTEASSYPASVCSSRVNSEIQPRASAVASTSASPTAVAATSAQPAQFAAQSPAPTDADVQPASHRSTSVTDAMLSLQAQDEEDEEDAAIASLAAIVHNLRRESSISMLRPPPATVSHHQRRQTQPVSEPDAPSSLPIEQESAVTRYLRLHPPGHAPATNSLSVPSSTADENVSSEPTAPHHPNACETLDPSPFSLPASEVLSSTAATADSQPAPSLPNSLVRRHPSGSSLPIPVPSPPSSVKPTISGGSSSSSAGTSPRAPIAAGRQRTNPTSPVYLPSPPALSSPSASSVALPVASVASAAAIAARDGGQPSPPPTQSPREFRVLGAPFRSGDDVSCGSLPRAPSTHLSSTSTMPLFPPLVDHSPSTSHLRQNKLVSSVLRRQLLGETVANTMPEDWHPQQHQQQEGNCPSDSADGIELLTESDKLQLGNFIHRQQSFSIIRGLAPQAEQLSPAGPPPPPPLQSEGQLTSGIEFPSSSIPASSHIKAAVPTDGASVGSGCATTLFLTPPALAPLVPPLETLTPTESALSTASMPDFEAAHPRLTTATAAPSGGDGEERTMASETADNDSDSTPSNPRLSRSSSVSFVAHVDDDDDEVVHVPATELVVPRTASLLIVRAPPNRSDGRISPAVSGEALASGAGGGEASHSQATAAAASPSPIPSSAPSPPPPRLPPQGSQLVTSSAITTTTGTAAAAPATTKRVARQQALADSFRNRIQVGIKADRTRKVAVRRAKTTDGSNQSSSSGGGGGSGSGSRGGHGSGSQRGPGGTSSSSRRRAGSVARRRSNSVHGRSGGSSSGRGGGAVVPHTHFLSVAFIGFFLSRLLAVVRRMREEKRLEEVGRPRAAYVIQCCWRAYKQRERVRRAEAIRLLVPWVRHNLRRLRRAKEASALLLQRVFRGQRDRSFHRYLYEQMCYNRALNVVRRRVGMWESRNVLLRLKEERDERNILIQQCEQGTVRILRQQRQAWAGLMREAHTRMHIEHHFTVEEWAAMVEEHTGFNPLVAEEYAMELELSKRREHEEGAREDHTHVVEPSREGFFPVLSTRRTEYDMPASESGGDSSTAPLHYPNTQPASRVRDQRVRQINPSRTGEDAVDNDNEEEDEDEAHADEDASVGASDVRSAASGHGSPRSPALVTIVPLRDDTDSAVCHARRHLRRPRGGSGGTHSETESAPVMDAGTPTRASLGVAGVVLGHSGSLSSSRSRAILSLSGAEGVVTGLLVSRTRLGQPETAMAFLNETFAQESAKYLDTLFPLSLAWPRAMSNGSFTYTSPAHLLGSPQIELGLSLSSALATTGASGTGATDASFGSHTPADRIPSPTTLRFIEPVARQDALYGAFVGLLESTEATSRRVLEQNLLDEHRSFLLPISVMNRVIAIHRTVPPLYAALLLSMRDEQFTMRAASLFRDEQRCRLAIIADYDAVPLASLNRPRLCDEAEARRQRLAFLARKVSTPLAHYEAEENEFLRKVLQLEQRRQLVYGGGGGGGGATHCGSPLSGQASVSGLGGGTGSGGRRGEPGVLLPDQATDLTRRATVDDDDDDEQQRSYRPIAPLVPAMKAVEPPLKATSASATVGTRAQRRFKVVLSSAPPSTLPVDETVMMDSTLMFGLERHDSVLTALTEEVAASERRRPGGAPMPMLRADPSTVSVRSFSGGGAGAEGVGFSSSQQRTLTAEVRSGLTPSLSATPSPWQNSRNHRHQSPVPQVQLAAAEIDLCEEDGAGNYALFQSEPGGAAATEQTPTDGDRDSGAARTTVSSAAAPALPGGAREHPSNAYNNNNNNNNGNRVRATSTVLLSLDGSTDGDADDSVVATAWPRRPTLAPPPRPSTAAVNAARHSTTEPVPPATATMPPPTTKTASSTAPAVQPPTLRALRQLGLARRKSPLDIMVNEPPPPPLQPCELGQETLRTVEGYAFHTNTNTRTTATGGGESPSPATTRRDQGDETDDDNDDDTHSTFCDDRAKQPQQPNQLELSGMDGRGSAAAFALPTLTVTPPVSRGAAPGLVPKKKLAPRDSDASTVEPDAMSAPRPVSHQTSSASAVDSSRGGGVTQSWGAPFRGQQHQQLLLQRLSTVTVATSNEDDGGDVTTRSRGSVATTVAGGVVSRRHSSARPPTVSQSLSTASEAIGVDHLSLFNSSSSSSSSSVFPCEKRGQADYAVSAATVCGSSHGRDRVAEQLPTLVAASTVVRPRAPPSPPPRRVHTLGP